MCSEVHIDVVTSRDCAVASDVCSLSTWQQEAGAEIATLSLTYPAQLLILFHHLRVTSMRAYVPVYPLQ